MEKDIILDYMESAKEGIEHSKISNFYHKSS